MGQKEKYNKARLEEHQRDHALYVAFAPAASPNVALAVIVENAGWGGAAAAPIARRVFDYLLEGLYPSEEDIAAVQKGLAGAPIGKPRLVSDMIRQLAADGAAIAPSERQASAQQASRLAQEIKASRTAATAVAPVKTHKKVPAKAAPRPAATPSAKRE